jgi:hypothetical protein
MKTEPVNTVASGHIMSCCLATGSQRVLLRDVSVFTTLFPGKFYNLQWLRLQPEIFQAVKTRNLHSSLRLSPLSKLLNAFIFKTEK